MKREVVFNKAYYDSLMKEFGYNPLEFEKDYKNVLCLENHELLD